MKRRPRLEDLVLLDNSLRPFDLANASGSCPTQSTNLPWPAEPSDSNGPTKVILMVMSSARSFYLDSFDLLFDVALNLFMIKAGVTGLICPVFNE